MGTHTLSPSGGTGIKTWTVKFRSPAPPVPAGLTATVQDNGIFLNWILVDQLTNLPYNLYRGTSPGGEVAYVNSFIAGHSYTDTNVSASTTYYYYLTRLGTPISGYSGESAPSNEANAAVPAAPNAPTSLATGTVTASSIPLTWTAPASGSTPTSYLVYKASSSNGETDPPLAIVTAPTTSYTATGLAPSTHYYFKVKSHNAGGNSSFSNEADATTSSGGTSTADIWLSATDPRPIDHFVSVDAPHAVVTDLYPNGNPEVSTTGGTITVTYCVRNADSAVLSVAGSEISLTADGAQHTVSFTLGAATGGTPNVTVPNNSQVYSLIARKTAVSDILAPLSLIVRESLPALDPTASATKTSTWTSGPALLWSDSATWTPSGAPGRDDIVSVPAGHLINVSGRANQCGRLIINGTVTVACQGSDTSTSLKVSDVDVNGGTLIVGDGTTKVAIVLLRNRPSHANDTAANSPDGKPLFWPAVYVHNAGTLIVNGPEVAEFVRLASPVAKGDTSIKVAQQPLNWAIGHKVFLPDTQHYAWGGAQWGRSAFDPDAYGYSNQGYGVDPAATYEFEIVVVRSITGPDIDGNYTVGLLNPALYNHPGDQSLGTSPKADTFLPHAAYLIRYNGFITSDPTSPATRAHIYCTDTSSVDCRWGVFHATGVTSGKDSPALVQPDPYYTTSGSLTPGTTYYYTASWYDANGESPHSYELAITVPAGKGGIYLQWTPPVGYQGRVLTGMSDPPPRLVADFVNRDVLGLRLYRRTSLSDQPLLLADVPVTTTSLTATYLDNGSVTPSGEVSSRTAIHGRHCFHAKNLRGPTGGLGYDAAVDPPEFHPTTGVVCLDGSRPDGASHRIYGCVLLEPFPVIRSSQTRWAYVNNDSHFGLIKDNISFNWAAGGFMFGPNPIRGAQGANESYNVIDGNFACFHMDYNNNGARASAAIDGGIEGTGIWQRTVNNYCRNNVSVNSLSPVYNNGYVIYPDYSYSQLGQSPGGGPSARRIPRKQGADCVGGVAGTDYYNAMSWNIPLRQFENNETYGLQQGLSVWLIGADSVYAAPGDPNLGYAGKPLSTIKNFSSWDTEQNVFPYPMAGITWDGMKARGYFPNLTYNGATTSGFLHVDYTLINNIIINADIRYVRDGIGIPEKHGDTGDSDAAVRAGQGLSGGTVYPSGCSFIVRDSTLDCYHNLFVKTMGAVTPGLFNPRNTWIDNCTFLTSASSNTGDTPACDLLAFWTTTYHTAPCSIQLDQIKFKNYGGSNLQVYWPQQAGSAITPQGRSLFGAPVAGQTNTYNSTHYNMDGTPGTGLCVADFILPGGTNTSIARFVNYDDDANHGTLPPPTAAAPNKAL